MASGEIHLLANQDKELEDFTEEELIKIKSIWSKIYESYLGLKLNEKDSQVLNINAEIEFLTSKYEFIKMAVECLFFDWHEGIVLKLRELGFKLTDSNDYYSDLDTINRESLAILDNIEVFRTQLPKEKTDPEDKEKQVIDFVFASYCAVLGIDFDFNTASFLKILGFEKQVEAKIKALETHNK